MKAVISAFSSRYANAVNSHAHVDLLPAVKEELVSFRKYLPVSSPSTLFDLGRGHGSSGTKLVGEGWSVTGVDPSADGIAQAHEAYPHLQFEHGSAYDDLAKVYGRFPVVISLEAFEHIYVPRDYARTMFDIVKPGETAIVFALYHGYLKNLALSVAGKMDRHFTDLWDHGQIKFWSTSTLIQLLAEAGFENIRFKRVGRLPALAKSMVGIGQKPAASPLPRSLHDPNAFEARTFGQVLIFLAFAVKTHQYE